MSTAHICPQCGKPLPSDAPKGQCPTCLLAVALAGQSNVQSAVTTSPESPSLVDSRTANRRLKYFGDYELLEEIAQGGMGVVWKARQVNLNRDVALKMIRAGALASPDEVARFLREAEAAANLQHPNIVAIHEVGEHDGQHYFSMDLVDGRDLGAIVAAGPLPPQRAARYVKIIAEAIHFAHQRGTLHRDLKPKNILIDSADQPRITDFGLAKIMNVDSQLTQSGVIMGSPSYMPPEQAGGRIGDIGPASDVYSLGAMLYELLTGQPPFQGATPLATLREVMESEPVAPRRLKTDIPPDLETICLKCLEKAPSARYATARALAEELNRFLNGEPIQARPAGAIRKVVSWGRQHPGTLVGLAALVMVSLAFGVFYLLQENAFLRAQQANPSLVRKPGAWHEALKTGDTIASFTMFAGIFSLLAVSKRARGLSLLARSIGTFWFNRPLQPLDARMRIFAIGAGLGVLVCGVIYLAMVIQAHVWEAEPVRFGQMAMVYALTYWGLAILQIVVRDYRLVHYGIVAPPAPASRGAFIDKRLTSEQAEAIRRAIEQDYDFSAAVKRYREALPKTGPLEAKGYIGLNAIKRYRDAVPGAGLAEAMRFVDARFEPLRAQHPELFEVPPLSLANLNLSLMLRTAVVEVVILAVLWCVVPPSEPGRTVWQLIFVFILGVASAACLRIKSIWIRILMVALPAALIAGDMLLSIQEGWPLNSIGLYLLGIFFGIFLMVSGFTPRRKRV